MRETTGLAAVGCGGHTRRLTLVDPLGLSIVRLNITSVKYGWSDGGGVPLTEGL